MGTEYWPTLNGTINVNGVWVHHYENSVQGCLGSEPVPILLVYFAALMDERMDERWRGPFKELLIVVTNTSMCQNSMGLCW